MIKKSKLQSTLIDTPIGTMMAVADEAGLYMLDFADCHHIVRSIKTLQEKTFAEILPGTTLTLEHIKDELHDYFQGKLKSFKTPFHLLGSPFQNIVWKQLMKVPYGQTISYKDQAIAIKNEKAIRAVGAANGANRLSIIIPCHRIINTNGELGGYGGGFFRKKWLLNHEKQFNKA